MIAVVAPRMLKRPHFRDPPSRDGFWALRENKCCLSRSENRLYRGVIYLPNLKLGSIYDICHSAPPLKRLGGA